jgi:putative Mg2+ transporter-C (MgtC) family protein
MTELEILARIAVAALLGGLVGFDREAHRGSAGLRTHVLVALGAAMFTVMATQLEDAGIFDAENMTLDPTRIIQGVITGIGFLGGAIVFRDRDDDRVRNVTTAAGIWVVTGIGIAAGLGFYLLASGVTVLALFVLYLLKVAEKHAIPD